MRIANSCLNLCCGFFGEEYKKDSRSNGNFLTFEILPCILSSNIKNQCVRRVAVSVIFRDLPVVQGREEDRVNGLTRAGGKQLRVMPDGSPTVIWET